MVAFCATVWGMGAASAETRTLKLYFIHTKERAEITYKRNGRYDQAGLKKINMFLRDWRRNEPTKVDPRLLDLVWSVYKSVGARDYINVVSAYRSPATNSMLRGRSRGVAKRSQHMLGKAMDFYIPGVSLKKLRDTGMKMQVGGVGYYPRSGSPFVHMDVGNVRHWPRMSRRELVALFPNGKTLHMPSDGKPLPGFDQAVASYEARKKTGATALALASTGSSKPSKGLLAALFGGGEDEDEEGVVNEAPAPAVEKKAPVQVAKAEPPAAAAKPNLPGIQIVSPDQANRVDIPVAAESEPEAPETPEAIIAALPARSVPLPLMAPRPKTDVSGTEVAMATVDEAAAVGYTPTDIPFGQAQDVPAGAAAAQPATEVALGIPLPTPRPNHAAKPAQDAAPGMQDEVLMALISADRDRPATSDAAAVPMPMARPDDDELLTALPSERPQMATATSPEDQAAVKAVMKANEARVAALASVTAGAAGQVVTAGIDPDTVSSLGVKTTRKTARATASDAKPDRKSQVKVAEPKAARWALNSDQMAETAAASTTAPSFAYNAVVTAPREVYTSGFRKDDQGIPNPNRFTGKSVEFLSVARFE
ncbi:DUF882 domain-containing protein [Mesorhizobium sp. LHD-90]|uniref:DUF882 domain-containing protein n=1 Tax=Mesorhizobium sp. LHD-90 TaxID=3071414 RepID=UPI0027E15628|nr:DUF882 domain-containing protein [Mesorhizobium sp. LHD-90]MDQ6433678.1 DUF882 domain-containing protein [Mesorhizobium sp. LHD-90]